jgi:transposase
MFFLGSDVAKLTLAVTLLTPDNQSLHFSCDNTPAGFAELLDWLQQHDVSSLHACLEATNVYWEAIATWLHSLDYTVSVVNPSRIKGFGQALMQRTKTDRQDSLVIALFCAKHQPSAWAPSSPEQRQLRDLVRLRHDLILSQGQQRNRLNDATNATVKAILQDVIDTLVAKTAEVDEQISSHIASHQALQAQVLLLTSIKGIGVVTATTILAEMGNLTHYPSAKAAAADVGVTPSHYESGTSVRRRPRMSKLGKSDLRAALYFPAMAAKRWCPELRAFAERLAARGKPKMVVIGAVMRKLIHICYGILKHQTPYDPAKVSPKTSSST